MKFRIVFLLILTSYFLVSCEDSFMETEEILPETIFPIKYVFKEVNFNPTEFFIYKEDSKFESFVPVSEELLMADSAIFEIVFVEEKDEIFPISEIELLSDSLVRIKVEGAEILSSNDNYKYQKIGTNEIIIDFFGNQVNLEITEDGLLKYCLQSFAYSYFDDFAQREKFRPPFGEPCTSIEKDEILNHIIEQEMERHGIVFRSDDIIILNISSFDLELIE